MKKFYLYYILFFISASLWAQDAAVSCATAKQNALKNSLENQRVESIEGLDNYDIHYLKLDLEATNESAYVEGVATIGATAVTNSSTVILQLLNDHTVDMVKINGVTAEFDHADDLITITLDVELEAAANFTIEVHYGGDGSSGGFFAGISNGTSESWGNKVTWTLSEPFGARDWWPAKQVLQDKIDSTDIYITVPNHLKAGSNGILQRVIELDNDRLRFEWETRYPMAYYLVSLAVAEYVEYNNYAFEGTDDEILIQNYVYNNANALPYFQAEIDKIPSMIELFSDLFGMYPYNNEKYGHTMAELGGGAMEHQTMSTMTGFYFDVDAHELVHQWFGDQVTCGTWQDIWINEGFASYGEYLANEFLVSEQAASSWLNEAHNYAKQNSTSGSVYVPEEDAENVNRIFSYQLSYKKGGAIIHMIRHELNDDELFFSILRTFLQQYKDQTAIGLDFKNVLETESGMDFGPFFDQWYFGEGYPNYQIKWDQGNDSLYVKSIQSTTGPTDFFEMTLDYKLLFADGSDSTIRLAVTQQEQEYKLKVEKAINTIQLDPERDLLMNVFSTIRIAYFPEEEEEEEPEEITAVTPGSLDKIVLYPNPANDQIYIANIPGAATVQLYDTRGQKIYNGKVSGGSTVLDIKQFRVGLYTIHIQTANDVTTKKLLIK